MDRWGWLVGYVLLFAVLHLLLYYFYVRREDGGQTGTPSLVDGDQTGTYYSSSAETAFDQDADRGDVDTETEGELEVTVTIEGESIRCPHCGVENEADRTFTYCWNCITALRR